MGDKLKGGLADGKTIEDIARKHVVFAGTIQKALEKGTKVELEHTNNKKLAREIAMDHLWEDSEYYEKLEKMENGKKEPKESTDSGSSGSDVTMPAFGKGIMKKDIYKIHNAKSLNEMDGIADMAYDAPIKDDPMEIDNPKGSTGTIMGNKKMDSKSIAVKKKNFPKYGGPESKFVSIDAKQTFPYSNQGDPKNSSLYEINGMREAVKLAAKKYGITVEQVEKIIMKESKQISERLPVGMWDDSNNRAIKSWTDKGNTEIYHLVTEEPLDIKTKDDVEMAKLKMILYKHDIKFEVKVHKD